MINAILNIRSPHSLIHKILNVRGHSFPNKIFYINSRLCSEKSLITLDNIEVHKNVSSRVRNLLKRVPSDKRVYTKEQILSNSLISDESIEYIAKNPDKFPPLIDAAYQYNFIQPFKKPTLEELKETRYMKNPDPNKALPRRTLIPSYRLPNVIMPLTLKKNMLQFCRTFGSLLVTKDARELAIYLRHRDNFKYYKTIPYPKRILRKRLGREEMSTLPRKSETPINLINYDERESTAFAASMSPSVYGAVLRVLKELQRRYANKFSPTSILDFGSGTAMNLWAASAAWPNSKFTYTGVERSSSMCDIARTFLVNRDNPENKYIFQNFNFQPVFPSPKKKFDITIASYALSEFPTLFMRRHIIREMWKRTKHFMVIVDYGSFDGFRSITTARELAMKSYKSFEPASIVAPCPHIFKCPRLYYDDNPRTKSCSFFQKVDLAFYEGNRMMKGWSDHEFSYLILRKNSYGAESSLPRIISKPVRRGKNVQMILCTKFGTIERAVFTKPKHPNVYNTLRFDLYSGDQVKLPPLSLPPDGQKILMPTDSKVYYHNKMNHFRLLELKKELNECLNALPTGERESLLKETTEFDINTFRKETVMNFYNQFEKDFNKTPAFIDDRDNNKLVNTQFIPQLKNYPSDNPDLKIQDNNETDELNSSNDIKIVKQNNLFEKMNLNGHSQNFFQNSANKSDIIDSESSTCSVSETKKLYNSDKHEEKTFEKVYEGKKSTIMFVGKMENSPENVKINEDLVQHYFNFLNRLTAEKLESRRSRKSDLSSKIKEFKYKIHEQLQIIDEENKTKDPYDVDQTVIDEITSKKHSKFD